MPWSTIYDGVDHDWNNLGLPFGNLGVASGIHVEVPGLAAQALEYFETELAFVDFEVEFSVLGKVMEV